MIDNNGESYAEEQIFYGRFWRRLGAQLLDGLLTGMVLFAIDEYDLTHLKSYWLYLIIGLIGMLYKPLMEYMYGATLGKIAFGLKVVNANYGKISLQQAAIRNIFLITSSVAGLLLNYLVFASPAFAEATTFMEVAEVIVQFPVITWVNNLFGVLFFIDALVLIMDEKKRALHDKIAHTYVIYIPSEE